MTQNVGSIGTDILILRVRGESIKIYDALKALGDDSQTIRKLLTTTSTELGNLKNLGAVAALVFFPLSSAPQLADTGEGKTYFDTTRKRFRISFNTFPYYDFPTPEAARVTHSADQNIPTAAPTVLTFNTIRHNHIRVYDAAFPTRLTAPLDGRYAYGLNVSFDDNTVGFRRIQIRKNGAAIINSFSAHPVQTAGENTDICLTFEDEFGAGDYIEALAYQNSGGGLLVVKAADYSPEFFMHRLG